MEGVFGDDGDPGSGKEQIQELLEKVKIDMQNVPIYLEAVLADISELDSDDE